MKNGLYFIIIAVLFIIATVVLAGIVGAKKRAKLRRYKNIQIGMPEDEMLSIMGKGYSRSLLKNNRTKYEWRIKASSTGYSSGGVSTRTYTGVRKVDIYCKDGYVEEVKPYNI